MRAPAFGSGPGRQCPILQDIAFMRGICGRKGSGYARASETRQSLDMTSLVRKSAPMVTL